jgi:hypothetical protein
MLIEHLINFVAQSRIKNTSVQQFDLSCLKTFVGLLKYKINEMKKMIFILFVVIGLTTISSCGKYEPSNSQYKYEVSGTSGNYSVTIQNTDDNTQQWSSVSNGWYYSWSQTGTRWLYLSAQNNTANGSVTVKIYKDGQVVASNTSYGAYSIATVSGDY